ncbi:hypothetical protein PpBr36_08388 [Pyricularia pennisetigena]|uniref:hypothetical protein n=1 Tax=Pyricularia pennisetigena TaxID=1578925 RepID=UPI00115252AC|nr:hypothetical protein PpBr36_08388 [Pyricularia pennisetigena]TLS24211.1 hypothetical protein PpBr36_08388 [Pyricularia pennisetigena]
MAPSNKTAASAAGKERRKSDKISEQTRPGLVTLIVPAERLRAILEPTPSAPPSVKEETPAKDSPAPSTTDAAAPTENAPGSAPDTPNANGSSTPVPPSVMGPPTEAPKKKGKRANGNGVDVPVKIRGKPGPKKKARLDDGSLEPGRAGGLGHKLGPKANQGAINAGLRALDRSGKPCRKWSKGGFQLKSFTGVTWALPRWTAPPRTKPEEATSNPEPQTDSAPASTGGNGSNKENGAEPTPDSATNGTPALKEENGASNSDKANSNNGGDVEMQNAPSLEDNSPAPQPIAAN